MNNLYGIYRGVVEFNADTEGLRRIKVRVFGVHSAIKDKEDKRGIPTEELPWAEQATPLDGSFKIPKVNDHVFVFFEGGNSNRPVYFLSSPGIVTEFPEDGPQNQNPTHMYNKRSASPPEVVDIRNSLMGTHATAAKVENISAPKGTKSMNNPVSRTIPMEPYTGKSYERIQNYKNDLSSKYGTVYEKLIEYAIKTNGEEPDDETLFACEKYFKPFDGGGGFLHDGYGNMWISFPNGSIIHLCEYGDGVVRVTGNANIIFDKDKIHYVKGNQKDTIDGALLTKVKAKEIREIDSDFEENIHGNQEFKVDENTTLEVTKDIEITSSMGKILLEVFSTGNEIEIRREQTSIKLEKSGNLTINTSGNCDIHASGIVDVEGSTINLN